MNSVMKATDYSLYLLKFTDLNINSLSSIYVSSVISCIKSTKKMKRFSVIATIASKKKRFCSSAEI